MNNLCRNNRGAVLVIAGVSLVALLGMAAVAVDIGRLYAGKARAQDICDASALGGVQSLDGVTAEPPLAKQVAEDLAAANVEARPAWPIFKDSSTTSAGVTVDFPTSIVLEKDRYKSDPPPTTAVEPGDAIRVQGSVEVEYGLARIFDLIGANFRKGRAHASAIAMITTAPGICTPFLAPFGISSLGFDEIDDPNLDYDNEIKFGTVVTLHYETWQDAASTGYLGAGNFGLINIGGGNSRTEIRDRLAMDMNRDGEMDTAGPCLSTGQDMFADASTHPGEMQGHMTHGMEDRFAFSNYSVSTYPSGSFAVWSAETNPDRFAKDSRIAVCPIIQAESSNGSRPVTIVGFAAFWMDSYDDTTKEIKAYFCEAIKVGGSFDLVPGANGDDVGTDSLKERRLVS